MTRCKRCDRALTNPISVKLGYGPVCRKKLMPKPRYWDLEEIYNV